MSDLMLTCLTYLAAAAALCLCEEHVTSARGQANLSGQRSHCAEPGHLLDMYTDLREQQIHAASVMETPGETVDAPPPPPPTRTTRTSTITRLAGHRPPGPRQARPGECRCRAVDELNHDPTRIPRMIPQSSCIPHRPWRTPVYSAECEEVYKPVKVKRRTGCSEGVYQYTDAWESIPVGCKCQVYRRIIVTRI